jgi:hypothetical protein
MKIPKEMNIYIGRKYTYLSEDGEKDFGKITFAVDKDNPKTNETAKKWVTSYYNSGGSTQPILVQNVPRKYSIVGIDHRKDNTVYRVADDEGLIYDMREYVFYDAMMNCKIEKGVIDALFVMGTGSGGTTLLRVGSDLHKKYLEYEEENQNLVSMKKEGMVIGDKYFKKVGTSKEILTYLGQKEVYYPSLQVEEVEDAEMKSKPQYEWKYARYTLDIATPIKRTQYFSWKKKKIFIFKHEYGYFTTSDKLPKVYHFEETETLLEDFEKKEISLAFEQLDAETNRSYTNRQDRWQKLYASFERNGDEAAYISSFPNEREKLMKILKSHIEDFKKDPGLTNQQFDYEKSLVEYNKLLKELGLENQV